MISNAIIMWSDTDSSDNDQMNMHQAWSDLSYIEHEQERYVALRSKTVSELDAARQQAVALENVMYHLYYSLTGGGI